MLLSLLTMYKYDDTLFDNFVLPPSLDRDCAINTIMLQCAELEMLYSNWETLHAAIGWWSVSRQWSWGKYAELLSIEYNPVENYDRYEDYTSNLSAESESVNRAAVYDQTGMVDTTSSSGSGSNAATNRGHIHGNIGVTTTQRMMQSELDLDNRMNVYDFIATDFKKRFCIMVY